MAEMRTRKLAVCEDCKLAFEYMASSHAGNRKRLCPECLKKRKQAQQKEHYRRQKEKRERERKVQALMELGASPKIREEAPIKRKKYTSELARINAQARERGMTYGQFVPTITNKKR